MSSVLITGGTTRLGKAIADHLRARGWRVFTSSHRVEAGADFTVDLSNPMGAAQLYAAVLERLGGEPPDALVNNAAVFAGCSDEIMRCVNLESPRKLTMLMAGRENGRGVVVNILDAKRREGVYGDTKRELGEYTASSAAMFADTLRVNGVSPGSVMAPIGVHEKADETPLGRPQASDVAEAVEYLLNARAVSGITIPVDGGAGLLQ